MAPNYTYAKVLWHKLSATSTCQHYTDVGNELVQSKDQLVKGLTFFYAQDLPEVTPEELSQYADITKLIADITGLHKRMALNIVEAYFMYEFRGAGRSLERYLNDFVLKRQLLEDIVLVYMREKLYILQCMKSIFVYSEDLQHPYFVSILLPLGRLVQAEDVYKSFCDSLQVSEVLTSIRSQCELLAQEDIPVEEPYLEVTPQLVEQWSDCKLLGQTLLAHIAMLVVFPFGPELPAPPETLGLCLKTYQEQDFGSKTDHAAALNGRCNIRICYLSVCQISVLLKLVLDTRHSSQTLTSKTRKTIEGLPQTNISSLLLLALEICHLEKSSESQDIELRSMVMDPVKSMLCLMENMEKMRDQEMQKRISLVILELFTLLAKYDPYLSDIPQVYPLCAMILRQSVCCDKFWSMTNSQDNPLLLLLRKTTDAYPVTDYLLYPMLTSLAEANGPSHEKVLEIISGMNHYTEILTTDMTNVARLGVDQLMTTAVRTILNGEIHLPKGTVGRIKDVPHGRPVVQWKLNFNLWRVIAATLKNVINDIQHNGSAVLQQKALPLLKCIESVMVEDWDMLYTMVEVIPQVFEYGDVVCSTLTNPPCDELAVILKIFTKMAKNHGLSVCNYLVSMKLVPVLLSRPDEPDEQLQQLVLPPPVDEGVLRKVLMRYEWRQADADFICAYLAFLLELTKRSPVLEPVVQGGIIVASEKIFASLPNHKFEDEALKDKISVLSLRLFHSLLGPYSDTEIQKKRAQLCVESLMMKSACPILLDIAVSGESQLEQVMLRSTCMTSGRPDLMLRKVQLALSVVNLVLQKKNLLTESELSSSFLLRQLSTTTQSEPNNVYIKLTNYMHAILHPNLPTLALKALEKIFEVIPLSLHSYMGVESATIRQTFELRLLAEDEYPPLRCAILDLLAVCVRTGTQSALLEALFVNEDVTRFTAIMDYLFGVLQAAEDENLATKYNSIYSATMNLLNAAWSQPDNFLCLRFKSRKDLWKTLMAPLMHQESMIDFLGIDTHCQLFRIVCSEVLNAHDISDAFEKELEKFFAKHCVLWNKALHMLVQSVGGQDCEPMLKNKTTKMLVTWSTVMSVVTSKRKEMVGRHTNVIRALTLINLKTLTELLPEQFQSPMVLETARLVLTAIMATPSEAGVEDAYSNQDAKLPDVLNRMLAALSAKYIYVHVDARTAILACVSNIIDRQLMHMKTVCRSTSFLSHIKMILLAEGKMDMTLQFARSGTSIPMAYLVLLRLLWLPRAYYITFKTHAMSSIINTLIDNLIIIIMKKSDMPSAETGMNILLATAQMDGLTSIISTQQLKALSNALLTCRGDILWQTVYHQGVRLCIRLLRANWISNLPGVLFYIRSHHLQFAKLLSTVGTCRARDHLLLVLSCVDLIYRLSCLRGSWSVKCIFPPNPQETMTLENVLQRALRSCVDTCVVLVTRPRIPIFRALDLINVSSTENRMRQFEKTNLLMEIVVKCIVSLQMLVTPIDRQLASLVEIPDQRRTLRVVSFPVTPGPSLARDYIPDLTFAQLNALCQFCLQELSSLLRSRSPAPSPMRTERTNPRLHSDTLVTSFDFTVNQACAYMKELGANPCLTRELHTSLTVILDEVNRLIDKQERQRQSENQANRLTIVEVVDSTSTTEKVALPPPPPAPKASTKGGQIVPSGDAPGSSAPHSITSTPLTRRLEGPRF